MVWESIRHSRTRSTGKLDWRRKLPLLDWPGDIGDVDWQPEVVVQT